MQTRLSKAVSVIIFVTGLFGLMMMFSETEGKESQWLMTYLSGAAISAVSFFALYRIEKRNV